MGGRRVLFRGDGEVRGPCWGVMGTSRALLGGRGGELSPPALRAAPLPAQPLRGLRAPPGRGSAAAARSAGPGPPPPVPLPRGGPAQARPGARDGGGGSGGRAGAGARVGAGGGGGGAGGGGGGCGPAWPGPPGPATAGAGEGVGEGGPGRQPGQPGGRLRPGAGHGEGRRRRPVGAGGPAACEAALRRLGGRLHTPRCCRAGGRAPRAEGGGWAAPGAGAGGPGEPLRSASVGCGAARLAFFPPFVLAGLRAFLSQPTPCPVSRTRPVARGNAPRSPLSPRCDGGCGNLLSAGLPPAGEGNAGALPLPDGSGPARVGLQLTGVARFGVRVV